MMSAYRRRTWLVVVVAGMLAGGMLFCAGCSDENSLTGPSTDSGLSGAKPGGPPTGTGTVVLSMNLSFASWTLIQSGPGGDRWYGWGPDTLEDLPVGTYQVIWGEVDGYAAKPASQRGRLKNNQTLVFETVYYPILTAGE